MQNFLILNNRERLLDNMEAFFYSLILLFSLNFLFCMQDLILLIIQCMQKLCFDG